MPPLTRIFFSAILALSLGLGAVTILIGISTNPSVRSAQIAALALLVAIVLFGGSILIALRMANWDEPQSEEDFDRLVEHSERLAAAGSSPLPTSYLNPFDDDDFQLIVAAAVDELPEQFQTILAGNLAIVTADNGSQFKAYGLYRGDGIARDNYPDQIIIFRDTLRRDFGAHPELLQQQITRTVRHEIAHHLGFDEPGVRSLGL